MEIFLEICRAEYEGVILFQTGSLQVTEEGPVIDYGKNLQEEADNRKKRIAGYWTKRSSSFKEQRRAELTALWQTAGLQKSKNTCRKRAENFRRGLWNWIFYHFAGKAGT